MFDIGWTELLVIGALALIVVGPRDLPHLMRKVGQTVRKIRRMAQDFQRSLEDATRDTDLAELQELRDLRREMNGLDFRKQAAKTLANMDRPSGSATKAETAEAETAEDDGVAEQAKTPETAQTDVTETPQTEGEATDTVAATAPETGEVRLPEPPAPAAASDAPRRSGPEDASPGNEPSEPRRASAGE